MSEETQAEIQRCFPRIDYREVRDGDLRLLPEAVTMDTYRPHRACRAYVAHRAAASAGIPLPALAEKAGIPLEVLQRKKPRYDALSGRIPAAYLAAIGVDFDDLRRCHTIDRAEYGIVNERAEFPKTYTVRTPNETVRVAFPAGVTKFHHALAHLLGCAARAATPASPRTAPENTDTRFVIAWPHVKVLEFGARDPLRIDLRSNRPVLDCGRETVPPWSLNDQLRVEQPKEKWARVWERSPMPPPLSGDRSAGGMTGTALPLSPMIPFQRRFGGSSVRTGRSSGTFRPRPSRSRCSAPSPGSSMNGIRPWMMTGVTGLTAGKSVRFTTSARHGSSACGCARR